jgi:hypothetical protein
MALSLGPYFEGRIELIVKESILLPLEFLDFEHALIALRANTSSKLRKA